VKRFLLDTNVVSETNRRAPSSSVIAWLESVPLQAIFISAVTVGELFVGARAVPHGRRHNELDVWLQGIVASQYAGRILAFDVDAGGFRNEAQRVKQSGSGRLCQAPRAVPGSG
jgi:predicted nucleic acid-binding protein